MALWQVLSARQANSRSKRGRTMGRRRMLRAEALEPRAMLSADPVLTITVHGFSGSNEGLGLPGWGYDMEDVIDAQLATYDAQQGGNIQGTVHRDMGPDDFTIAPVAGNTNLDLAVDWRSGMLSSGLLNMQSASGPASQLATGIWNFLETQKTLYNQQWDVVLIGYSRGGFFTQYLTQDLQSLQDAAPTHARPDYVTSIMLDPTGVRSVDTGLFQTNNNYVVPSVVDRLINYNDARNLFPLVTVDGLTMVRGDGTGTGISNVNIQSAMNTYISQNGLGNWYTPKAITSHIAVPDWYLSSASPFVTDVASFITSKDVQTLSLAASTTLSAGALAETSSSVDTVGLLSSSVTTPALAFDVQYGLPEDAASSEQVIAAAPLTTSWATDSLAQTTVSSELPSPGQSPSGTLRALDAALQGTFDWQLPV